MINTKEIELMLKKLMFLYIKECIEVKSNLLKNEQVGVPVNEVYNEVCYFDFPFVILEL